jgi:hypothetical protein
MANDLSKIMMKILAKGHMVLRKTAKMPMLVSQDYQTEAAKKGQVINVPIPRTMTTAPVTPSNTPPVPTDYTPDEVQIPMDYWEHVDFYLTDKDLVQVDKDAHFVPMALESAVKAMAEKINETIFDEYKGVYGIVGTPGTTPFATTDIAARDLREQLHKQLCPNSDRRAVLDFAAEKNALGLASFRDLSQSGKDAPVIEGTLGRFYGIDWFNDHQVPSHIAGAAAAATVTMISQSAAGASSVTLKVATGTAEIKKGDIISFAGHAQTYVVTATATLNTTGVAVAIAPRLQVAVDGSTTPVAVTIRASHVVNLGFHKQAFVFASRPLAQATMDADDKAMITTLRDPLTGIILRIEKMRQYKQVVWDIDCLWGAKLVRPELAARIAG